MYVCMYVCMQECVYIFARVLLDCDVCFLCVVGELPEPKFAAKLPVQTFEIL